MYAELTFGDVWTLEYLLRQRIATRLWEGAQMAAADITANRERLRALLDDLTYELDAVDVTLDPPRCGAIAAAAPRMQAP